MGLSTVAGFNGHPKTLSPTFSAMNIPQCGIMLTIVELPLKTSLTACLSQRDVGLRFMETDLAQDPQFCGVTPCATQQMQKEPPKRTHNLVSCIAGRFFTIRATREAPWPLYLPLYVSVWQLTTPKSVQKPPSGHGP